MKARLITTLILIGILSFGAGLATVAYFTSQATSEDNVFETGTLIIGVPEKGRNSGIFDIGDWQPGDSATESLTVKNLGSLPMKYKLTAEFPEEVGASLKDVLEVVITKGGNEIYRGPLSGLAEGLVVNEDFAPEASEDLVFTVSMPASAGNEYQGASVKVTFVFDATQTNRTDDGWDEYPEFE